MGGLRHAYDRERKQRRRRNRMLVHGKGVFTLNDLLERGKFGKPQRGGKREIVVEKEDINEHR